MQKQRKISTLVGIIIIVAAVIILFGGVFAYQYFATNNHPQVQNQTDQTAGSPAKDLSTEGWKTYKNDEYGFELKYPGDFVVEKPVCCTETGGVSFEDLNGFTFSVIVDPIIGFEFEENYKKSEHLSVNGLTMFISYLDRGSISSDTYRAVVSIEGKDAYMIISGLKKGIASQEKLFKEILSTFKFTE